MPENRMPSCELTDLPRLLCGCPEHNNWAFEWEDLEPEEVAYLEVSEDADAEFPEPLAAKLTVVQLPTYVAEEWTAAANPPLPASGNTCQTCKDRPAGDAFVCPDCLDDLRVHLGDVPGLLADLDVLANREAVVNSRPREAKRPTGTRWDRHLQTVDRKPQLVRTDDGIRVRQAVPDNPGRTLASAGYNRPLHVERAVLARDQVANEVSTSVRIIAETHAIAYPAMDIAGASRWLLVHLDTIGRDPAGPDIAAGVQRAHSRAMAAIDNVEDGVYLGLCDKCQAAMHADPDQHEHRCTTCGETYQVAGRREAQRDKVRHSLLSVKEIADYSASDRAAFGARLHETQIKRWIGQSRLLRAGSRPGGPRGEIALYRASDVLSLVGDRSGAP